MHFTFKASNDSGWIDEVSQELYTIGRIEDAIDYIKDVAKKSGWEYVNTIENVIFLKCSGGTAVAVIHTKPQLKLYDPDTKELQNAEGF